MTTKNEPLLRALREFRADTGTDLPLLEKILTAGTQEAATKRARYHSDPDFRSREIQRAKKWNEANPERKRATTRKSDKKNGAARARRYRARKRAQAKEQK